MAVDNRTENRDYPLPDPTNLLNEDVERLIAALEAIDADVAEVASAVAEKADAEHEHEIVDVTGLQDALDSKAASNHEHGLNDLIDVDVSEAANGQVLKRVGTKWNPATLQIGDVNGLQDALETPSSHNHDDRYYTKSQTELLVGTKADSDHGHEIADIDGLNDALESKQDDLGLEGLADGDDFRAGTDDKNALTTKAAYDAMAEVELTYASTITIDLTEGTDFAVTLDGNPTFANPTNADKVIGKKGRIRISHSNRAAAFGSNWEFPNGEAPDLSSGSNKTDILYYDVIAADRILGVLVPEIS